MDKTSVYGNQISKDRDGKTNKKQIKIFKPYLEHGHKYNLQFNHPSRSRKEG